jgi:anthranilate phosphoribosyltransferase
VLLYAAAALLVAGTVADLGSGVELARESIDTGAARDRALRLAAATRAGAGA